MAEDTYNNNTMTTITQLASGTEIGGRSDWGNKLVVNTGTHPVINFAFMLRVEGIFDLPCKSIKGIRRENEFDHIQEGGLNDYVHLKRKPITKPFTFQVERYVGVNWIDPMPLGTELTLPVILFVNKYSFPGLDPVRTYAFTGCTVISKDYGELNAEASGLLVETVTIAYREMVCIDIPSETLEEDTWKFKGKEKEGQGPRNYNSNLYNKEWEKDYNSKAKMEARAKLSKFAKTSSEITPKMAKHIENETTKAAMEAKAEENRWKPEKDTDGGLKTKYGNTYEKYVKDFNAEIDKQIENAADEKEKETLKAMKKSVNGATSKKYEHSGTAKKYSSAKYNAKEATKTAMEAKAESMRWTGASGKTNKYGNSYERYVSNHNAAIDKEIAAATTPEEKAAAEGKKIAAGSSASRKYEHSGTAKKYSSAKYHKKELSKEAMEKRAKKWSPESEEKAKSVKPTPRLWPEKSSATTDKMEKSKAKLWPNQSSASREQMKTPEPRLWPKTRSARQITDFLKNH